MRSHFPIVLDIELHVRVAVLAGWIVRRLIEAIEDASGSVGEPEPGIERVAGVINKVDVAVGIREDGLVLPTMLIIEAGLQGMFAHDLAEVVNHIKRSIVVKK